MIAAVVPTYNRKDSLMRTILALQQQTRPLDEIIVVDNASTDGTRQFLNVLQENDKVTIIRQSENSGSEGGFAAGINFAYVKGYEWVWTMDDDALPENDALEELLRALEHVTPPTRGKVGMLVSVSRDPVTGELWGVGYWRRRGIELPQHLYSSSEPLLVDIALWAGLLLNRHLIRELAMPRVDFFIDQGDWEYCLRARQRGFQIVAVPSSCINHQRAALRKVVFLGRGRQRVVMDPWRLYYKTRNGVFLVSHIRWNALAIAHALYVYVRHVTGVILFDDKKYERVRMHTCGLYDGLMGQMGKKYSP